MNNLFSVNFSVIGNRNCVEATVFSKSVKKAVRAASEEAWEKFNNSNNTNWADCWVRITNPRHKVIFAGFESDLC
jgi:hypothetical protein